MSQRRFSVLSDILRYSRSVVKALGSPLITYLTIAGNSLLFLCATGFFFVEKDHNPQVSSYFDAVWWAFCTITTVGFGDVVPVTIGGKLIGMFLMTGGVVFFFGFTAFLITLVSHQTTEEIVESERLTFNEYRAVMAELDKLSKKLDAYKSHKDEPKA